ncbi:hypothetical protein A5672_06135 [Mycobacterium alsense]|uniref:DUF2599 domain-containing protein n=1 Tax=Mycobacterium alsense TaxID=324058 RepID=A0ABD6NSI0_9MYCO|nr:DUF2599 domain-containing protein [Mycobacterium alsense]OBG26830.1 hypothetical protein A5672_06135 [Mycobacterium alsense]OBI96106.1 hypothetical protein A5660_09525 [Mycobacterium alsense]
MKAPLVAPAAVAAMSGVLLSWSPQAPAASADPGAAQPALAPSPQPPFVDHTQWARWQGLPSLRVFPTPSGRTAARQPGTAADEAWAEVLALAPDADTPGMRAQFVCHWQFAELAQPGKASWNLEPWRPVVDDAEMVATGCNPGGPEEAF